LAQVRAPNEQPAPEAEWMAPQFSKNSLWWNLNQANGLVENNGHAPNKPAVKPAKVAPRVVAAGG
jgi:hypothetical protein